MKIIETRARTVDITINDYYDILFAFHSFRGDMRRGLIFFFIISLLNLIYSSFFYLFNFNYFPLFPYSFPPHTHRTAPHHTTPHHTTPHHTTPHHTTDTHTAPRTTPHHTTPHHTTPHHTTPHHTNLVRNSRVFLAS